MYAITATISQVSERGWHSTRQVPTFYLDENVQGITSESGAVKVARSIIDPYGKFSTAISAVKL